MKEIPLPLDWRLFCYFWTHVSVRAPGECWPWRPINGGGRDDNMRIFCGGNSRYGKIGRFLAHRVAFALYTGRRRFDALDHVCARTGGLGPSCVNPLHLEEVGIAENARRGSNRRRHAANRRAYFEAVA